MTEPHGAPTLPERANLDQLRKQAKDALASDAHPTLAAAQLAVARRYGFPSWAKLKRSVELTTLYRLITEGEVEPVRALLDSAPGLLNARFGDGSTPIHLAAGENRPELVTLLVQMGASLTAKLADSAHTPLSWAVTTWSYAAAETLVGLGMVPDLFCAAGLGLEDAVRAFWNGGQLRKRPSSTGSSRYDAAGKRLPCPPAQDQDAVSDALYIACRTGRLGVSRWLLDQGADPNWRGYAGATCLAWAEFSGDPELAALLRAHGGSDELTDAQYQAVPTAFPVMVYAGWGFAGKLADRLALGPAVANLRGGRGTVLHAAAEGGQIHSVRMLLQAGADPRALNPEGLTPAEVAQAKGFEEIVRLLGG